MLEDNSDIPILSNEEIQLFVDSYNRFGTSVSYSVMKRWIYNTTTDNSTIRKAFKIPYEDLPLLINEICISHAVPSKKSWYGNCIAIRLKIGK